MSVKTVGLDLAKDVFQVHGISENGRVILNKAIKRAKLLAFFENLPPCIVGMEACGSGSVEAMPKHKQARHTTVLTKKTANIARKRLQCRSHPHTIFIHLLNAAAQRTLCGQSCILRHSSVLIDGLQTLLQLVTSSRPKRLTGSGSARAWLTEPRPLSRSTPLLSIELISKFCHQFHFQAPQRNPFQPPHLPTINIRFLMPFLRTRIGNPVHSFSTQHKLL